MCLKGEQFGKHRQHRKNNMALKRISVCLSAALVALTGGTGTIWAQQQCESQPVTAGYRDYNFDSGGVNSEPTEEKPESKLWYTDGSWWGIMWDPEADVFSIHRFDRDNQCWTAVGPASDDRGRTSQDAYWDESIQKLYLASHGKPTIPAGEDQSARLYRFSYNSGSDTYTLDSGFPVNINGVRSRSLVITKESTGKLWASWTSNLRVMVNSATNDGANWGIPFELPGQGNDLKTDASGKTIDISSIIWFNGDRIGVLWGNQLDKKYYFMVHVDGDPDASWQPREIALQGFFGNAADDHINLARPSDHSTVLGVLKSDINGGTNPLIRVVKRDPGTGVWTASTFGIRSENHTRPVMLVDSDTDSVYVFAKSSDVEPKAIYYKVAHVDDLNFPSGLGRVFLHSDVEDNINNPTSTKQNVNANSGLLVLASNKQNKRYMHNFLTLGGNHGPVAVDDVTSTPQNTPVSIDVTANDTDEDNSIDVTTVQFVDSTSDGALSLDGVTGIVTYTPTSGFLGMDSFRYSVRDQDGESSLAATVTITVHVNSLPVAQNDSDSTDEEKAVTIDVLGNDSDSDGVVIVTTVQIVSTPTNGSAAVIASTGEIIYTPNTDFMGTDAFSYTVSDNSGGTSNAATVTVTVADINDPPVASNDAVVTDEEIQTLIDVTANDSDIDGTIDVTTVSITSPPSDGIVTVDVVTGEVTYTPNQDFVGADGFTYTVNDEDGATSNVAAVSVTVNPINDPPVAAPDTAVIDEDQFVAIAVLSNDTDVDGTIVPSTLSIISQPSNGSVSVNTVNGLVTYTPNTGFNGTDSFDYTVDDNEGAVSQPGTVTVIVNDINDPPVAADDAAETSEDIPRVVDVLANDSDSDGTLDPASITIITDPSSGATSVNTSTGEITYSPNLDFFGDDSFTYTVNDDDGASSNEATVTIEVGGINDPPVAVADRVVTIIDSAVDIDVTVNDTDVDGTVNPATVAPTAALNGTIAVLSGGLVRYTPNIGFDGNDTFTYTIKDDQGLISNEATVLIKINNFPVAVDDNVFTQEDIPVTMNVLANDTDVDGTIDPTTVVIGTNPTNGSLSVHPTSGEITYTPNLDFVGSDSFTYSVKDEDGGESNVATVTVSTSDQNDPPLAVDDSANTHEGVTTQIRVLTNDGDIDGILDVTSVVIVTSPANGSASADASTGVVTYTPSVDFFGTDTFTYTVRDGIGLISNVATVTIDVNDRPEAVDDSGSTTEESPVTLDVASNDTDSDGTVNPTTVTIATQPANGSATVVANGDVRYLPSLNFEGFDFFTYTVADDKGGVSNPATVSISVGGTNDPPVAVDDAVVAREEVSLTIDVASNDRDPDVGGTVDATTVALVSSPTNGAASVDPTTGLITYVSKLDFSGADSFTYTIDDNTGLTSNVATVSITVNPVNDAPIAQNDAAVAGATTPVVIDVLANDSGTDGVIDPTTVSIVSPPFNGTTSVDPVTGTVTYTANTGFSGGDGFVYTVADNNGLTSNAATVNINVSGRLLPTDDTFVRSSLPNRNYGGGDVLRVRTSVNGARQIAYLKFSVSGIDVPVISAKLFLFVVDGSDKGGSLFVVSNNLQGQNTPWTENELVFDNAPSIDGNAIADIGPVTAGQTVEIDLSSVITASGTYSFAIRSASEDPAEYSPKEQPNPPALIIETAPQSAFAPTISAFSPISGPAGTDVTITGTNLLTTTEVRFGGQAAGNFEVLSGSQIRVTVPSGATTGRVIVTNAESSASSKENFTVFLTPGISSISPLSGPIGAEVTVNGANLTGATSVTFNGTPANSFSLNSDTQLTVQVPSGASTGPVGLVNAAGSATSVDVYTVVETPTITSFSPSTGSGGTEVTITGSNFVEIASVSFNGVAAASFIVDSASELRAVAPGGGSSGPISVSNAAGTAISANSFDLLAPPTITSFAPAGGLGGTEVTINGTGFSDANNVSFNGVSSTNFTINSDTQIRTSVPPGVVSGPISVTNSIGTGISATNFVASDIPNVSGFSPLNGSVGAEVTIFGSNFANATDVRFNGALAAGFRVDSDTRIRAAVPNGATSGRIRVGNVAGGGESVANFIIAAGPSTLTFNPTDDSFVRSNRATSNYGDGDVLRARRSNSGTDQTAYLKFAVTGITGSVESARIRLLVRTESPEGGSIFAASNNFLGSNNPWNEEEIVFANAPGTTGSPLSTLGAVNFGETVEFDVTSAITGNGVFSFAISSTFDDVVEYAPKETGNAPELVIELSGGAPPNAPTISAFSPASGVSGTEVTIFGSNFSGATDVFFNGISAASFSVDTNSQIRAVVGPGATSGRVGVSSPDGTALSATDFAIVGPPSISIFTPASGSAGTEVTVTGSNFTGVTAVRVNSLFVASFTVDSDTRLRLTVPVGASTGPIDATNAAGTGTSASSFAVVLPPAVSAFTPSSGPAGTEVTLSGSNLASVTNVFFNGVATASFTIDSDAQVRAVVPTAATSGPVSVTNATGTGISTNSFGVLGPPVVTSFSPAGGTPGIEVTVFGGNFDGVTGVAFNGVPAAGFTLDSPTLLRTTVPSGATSGPVSVTNNLGTGISATNFVVTPVPTVSSFSPLTGSVDTEVTITGSSFSNVTNVEFGVAQSVGFTIDSATKIRANVPAGATSGPIRVTNISGTGTSSASFIVTAGSSTLTFDPVDDAYVRANRANDNFGAGTVLRVRRSNSGVEQFSYMKFDITGITGTVESAKLRLFVVDPGPQGGAAFSVSNNWDENSITFSNAPEIGGAPIISVGEVSAGQTVEFDFTDAISGNGEFSCAIKNSSDDAVEYASRHVANGPQLVIEQSGGISPNAPVITAFSPAGGVSGTEVTITGSNFSGTTNVFFNNLSASSFSADSNTQIRAVVAGGTTTGLVGVSTANGTGLSVTNFVLVNPPTISSFSPLSGPAGTEITLNGSNFSGTLGVSFNGLFASTFTVDTDSRIRVSVPTGASTGAVIVENAAGTGTSGASFAVTLPPVVTSFTPTSGSIGTVVTITGTNFSSATGVSFNGAVTSTFSVDSATRIRASVPNGAGNGAVGVSNVAGTGISSSPFEVLAPPTITSFSPAGGDSGVEVTIFGTNLDGVISLAFNGTSASFAVDSGTLIRATVPNRASTGPISATNNIGTGISSTNFVVTPPPGVISFTPLTGSVGTEVTITGNNFLNVTSVAFGVTPSSGFSIDSDSQVRATVPVGATSGQISVSNISGNGSSAASFIVISGPSTLTFQPTDDSYVRANKPDRNSGDGDILRVRKSSSGVLQVSYLKFNVTGVTGEIDRATLRLFVEDGGSKVGSIFSVSNNWDENTITFNNAPEITGNPLQSLGGVATGQTLEFDVSAAISDNGVFSFAIRNDRDDAVEFASKEIANGPELVIEQSGGSSGDAPVISAFSPAGGVVGTEVTIIGTNLLHGAQVSFNGFPTTGFIADSETQLRVSVPFGASTGLISVSNAAGTGTSINLFIVTDLPSSITLNPTDDVYVHSGKPDRNHAHDDNMRVRKTNSNNLIAYLKFNVTGLNGAPESATLRLFVQDASNDGGAVFKVSNNFQGVASPWNEESLVFNNAPEISGSAIAALGSVNANQTVEFDVTSVIDGNGTYSFAISNASDDLLIYSANGSANPPELFLQTNDGPTTVPTITSIFPTSGVVGTEVTLTGLNFSGVSRVEFNGTSASNFTVDSDTRIRAVPLAGTSTGKIGISSPSGSGFSTQDFVVLLPPVITSFSPVNAPVGAEITINGSRFNGVSSVLFSNTSASFIVDSIIRIRAIVPSAATQGRISVTNPDGTGASADEFAVSTAPVVTSFTPPSAAVGAEVTITGTNFTGATGVEFSGIAASTFVVDSDAQMRATIPGGASTGKVRVTNSDGSSLSANDFVVIATPAISSFTPASGQPGTEITIAGSGFAGVTAVAFNGIAASSFIFDSDTQLRASVPAGASPGPITVSNVAGTDTSSTNFDIPTGVVSLTFNPIADAMVRSDAGGDNFGDGVILRARLTGSGAQHRGYMKFDVTGLGTVVSAKIRLVVVETGSDGGSLFRVSNDFSGTTTPWTETGLTFDNAPDLEGGALGTLGAITVGQTVEFDVTSAIEADGVYSFALSSTSNDAAIFHSKEGTDPPELLIETEGGVSVPTPPIVTSFSPSAGPVGTEVTITGSNLDGATAVSFNAVAASSYSVISDIQVRAVVPAAATSGSIRVSNPDGTGISQNAFSVLLPPSISSFSPGSGPAGTEVTISGTNFSALTDISFNGTSAANMDLDSDTQVRAQVPNGASTGPIAVSNSVGNSTSSGDFTITTIPGIASFTPTSGVVGTEITITGSNFSGASAVSFSGASATNFTVDSDSQIHAEVPPGAATGKISVTNGDGTGSSSSNFTIVNVPTITFFSPASGAPGSEVTIFGSNFVGVTKIIFNGAPATSFILDSASKIRASVPPGGTSGPISITNDAGTAVSATSFEVSSGGGPFSFLVTEDTYVRSSRPTNTFGNNADLKVRKASTADRNVYLKFTVSGVTGTVESVKIRLACTDGSQEGGSIVSVSNNFIGSGTPWTEEALAWENAPAIAGAPLVTLGFVTTGQIVEFDVTAAVAGDGTYSFAIVNNTSDLANYSSKESATQTPPVMVITTVSGLTKRTSDTETASEESKQADEELLPDDPTLLPNYPNPFNIETTIQYALPAEAKVKLRIFNLRGQVVRVLVDEVQKAGIKRISWNGRNAKKKVVATGVYFVRLEVGGLKFSRKITLQK